MKPIPEGVMRDLRENRGLKPNDTSQDQEINNYSTYDLLDKWLEWQGISGYTHHILGVIMLRMSETYKQGEKP